MRDYEDRGFSFFEEVFIQFLLDEVVRFEVNISCRFIKHQYPRPQDHSPCQTNQLLLPQREQIITLSHPSHQTLPHFLYHFLQLHFLQHLPNLSITMVIMRVQILPHRPMNQKWTLRNICHVFP